MTEISNSTICSTTNQPLELEGVNCHFVKCQLAHFNYKGSTSANDPDMMVIINIRGPILLHQYNVHIDVEEARVDHGCVIYV